MSDADPTRKDDGIAVTTALVRAGFKRENPTCWLRHDGWVLEKQAGGPWWVDHDNNAGEPALAAALTLTGALDLWLTDFCPEGDPALNGVWTYDWGAW